MSSDRIFAVVARIPSGRVATYGQIAKLAGLPGQARRVGYALHGCGDGLPWHRVVNAQGRIALGADTTAALTQRRRLAQEGVDFTGERVDLARFLWVMTNPGLP